MFSIRARFVFSSSLLLWGINSVNHIDWHLSNHTKAAKWLILSGRRAALSAEPCLETYKTAKPAIHGRSVYNLHRPLTAKQPAQIHPGPLRGGEEQSNYILKQQSEAGSACKQTSSTHTNWRIQTQEIRLLSTLENTVKGRSWMCLSFIVLHMYSAVQLLCWLCWP